MNEVKKLETEFQYFQQTGLNSGGIWKIVEIIKNGKSSLESLIAAILTLVGA